MTNEELGRRAVACSHWRWMPGMLPLALDDEGDWMPCERVWVTQGGKPSPPQGAIPDLTDAATLGCLLALVRDSKKDAFWQVLCLGEDAWSIEGADYATEAEALVAALEAAESTKSEDETA